MRVFTLKRVVSNSDGTYSIWINDKGFPKWVTYELPFKNNQHDVSSIPAGEYTFNLYLSPKRGYVVYKAIDVPNRDSIEIHIGNCMPDTDGCLLVGTSFGIVSKEGLGDFYGVKDSQLAFKDFMSYMNGETSIKVVILDV